MYSTPPFANTSEDLFWLDDALALPLSMQVSSKKNPHPAQPFSISVLQCSSDQSNLWSNESSAGPISTTAHPWLRLFPASYCSDLTPFDCHISSLYIHRRQQQPMPPDARSHRWGCVVHLIYCRIDMFYTFIYFPNYKYNKMHTTTTGSSTAAGAEQLEGKSIQTKVMITDVEDT
jgi:hypothetical protein